MLRACGARSHVTERGGFHLGCDEPFFGITIPDPTGGCLDGDFTADQLEAIAMWMRCPFEV